jgi:hypothetical protein
VNALWFGLPFDSVFYLMMFWQDPELMAAFSDPEIMAALQDGRNFSLYILSVFCGCPDKLLASD